MASSILCSTTVKGDGLTPAEPGGCVAMEQKQAMACNGRHAWSECNGKLQENEGEVMACDGRHVWSRHNCCLERVQWQ
jgi:hypothetical protein